jgi:hypothetical protein
MRKMGYDKKIAKKHHLREQKTRQKQKIEDDGLNKFCETCEFQLIKESSAHRTFFISSS